ncbi:hypothetical protein [Ferrimicrobium sp.]|uniref:hypothetical protein n=1 Tax=Ferrimicrobium sp. TaxID=2926050 RepID=UPI00260988BE|nr:hypothetical protein [Ferrimicrobium sp.]
MSSRPLLVVIDNAEVAANTLAHLASYAHHLRIRCLDSALPLAKIPGGGLAITSVSLDYPWRTLTPRQALALDPATLVQAARQATAQAMAPLQVPISEPTAAVGSDARGCTATDTRKQTISDGVEDTAPLAPTSTEKAIGAERPKSLPSPPDLRTRPHRDSSHGEWPTATTSAKLRSPSPSTHPAPGSEERDFGGLSDRAVMRGCHFIPVLGLDPGLTAQLGCLLAQLFAEHRETILVDFERGGLQRFLHDLPIEAPSIDDFAHTKTPTPLSTFAQKVAQRGYRVLGQPLIPRPTRQLEPDQLERTLELFGESAATIIAPLGSSVVLKEAARQADGVDLLPQSLLHQTPAMVLTTSGSLVSTYQLVNLIRQTIGYLPHVHDLLIVIAGSRDALRRGRNLHQLLEEAIPESLSRLVTLEIVTLGDLALDELHEKVLPFPVGLLRPLRPFARRISQLPPIKPSLHAEVITHPFYEQMDPLIDFFAKAEN